MYCELGSTHQRSCHWPVSLEAMSWLTVIKGLIHLEY